MCCYQQCVESQLLIQISSEEQKNWESKILVFVVLEMQPDNSFQDDTNVVCIQVLLCCLSPSCKEMQVTAGPTPAVSNVVFTFYECLSNLNRYQSIC